MSTYDINRSGEQLDAALVKVDGIESEATKNATDAQLRDRSTHTGVQAISTIEGLQAALEDTGQAGRRSRTWSRPLRQSYSRSGRTGNSSELSTPTSKDLAVNPTSGWTACPITPLDWWTRIPADEDRRHTHGCRLKSATGSATRCGKRRKSGRLCRTTTTIHHKGLSLKTFHRHRPSENSHGDEKE